MNLKIEWNPTEFIKILTGSLFTRELGKNLPQGFPQIATPQTVAGGFRVSIPQTVQKTTDIKSIDFARGHHHISDRSKRQYCVVYKKLEFKHGSEKPLDTKWVAPKTAGRYLQCNVTLYLERRYFELYSRHLGI